MARKGNVKVRTGCLTCKIRKVKCPEEKPSCSRCTSTGRKCDGYPEVPKRDSKNATKARHGDIAPLMNLYSLLDVLGDDRQRRYLDFFQTRTAPMLSGHFDSDRKFWNHLVLQASHVEPTVRHAVLTIGFLHEQSEAAMMPPDSNLKPSHPPQAGAEDSFAIEHYNRAIHSLIARVNGRTDGREDITLLSCILFICIEFFQNRIDPALTHLQQGLDILTDLESTAQRPGLKSGLIREHAMPIFSRLSILPLMFGTNPTPIDEMTVRDSSVLTALETPLVFSTLQDARSFLIHLMRLCLNFIQSAYSVRYDTSLSPNARLDSLMHQHNLIIGLEQWYTAFQPLIPACRLGSECDEDGSNCEPSSSETDNMSNILRTYYLVSTIWTQTALSPNEMVFDDHMPSFSSIVTLVSSLTLAEGPLSLLRSEPLTTEAPHPSFSFEMGIIPPLYFTAIKCRHLPTRTAALKLLSSSITRRENLWDASIMARVASRVIEMERGVEDIRGSLSDHGPVAEAMGDEAINISVLPPDSRRVYDANIDHDVVYEAGNAGASHRKKCVTFLTRPGGLDGEWNRKTEWLVL